jgi:hypothetical protein
MAEAMIEAGLETRASGGISWAWLRKRVGMVTLAADFRVRLERVLQESGRPGKLLKIHKYQIVRN